MPTLYHSPQSRSSTVVALIDELKADVKIKDVMITKNDGSGGIDPTNPHPEGKVPFLVDGSEIVRERAAIMLYLTDKYPAEGLGPLTGEAGRGAYLSWLTYYQGVMEPVLILDAAKVENPITQATFRDKATMIARLEETLERQPYLLGESFSAADMLCASPFGWFPDMLRENTTIREWVERCSSRPSLARTAERDLSSSSLKAE